MAQEQMPPNMNHSTAVGLRVITIHTRGDLLYQVITPSTRPVHEILTQLGLDWRQCRTTDVQFSDLYSPNACILAALVMDPNVQNLNAPSTTNT